MSSSRPWLTPSRFACRSYGGATVSTVFIALFLGGVAMLAQKQAAEWGVSPEAAVLKAITAYHNGGVVAEFRLLGNPKSDMTYRTISLEPIAIIDVPEAPALTEGEPAAEQYDDLPF